MQGCANIEKNDGVTVMKEFEELVFLLKEKGLKISAAESCTGGMFASYLVGVPDASKVLSASFVTYSEEAKTKYADVNIATIEKYGVVSENVAVEMAKGVCKNNSAEVGLGITGYAGPSASSDDTDAGTVCFGFCVNGITVSSVKHFGDIGRNAVRELSVLYAANTLTTLIKKFGDKK